MCAASTPPSMTARSLLEAVRGAAPDRVAFDDGARQLSYGQLAPLLEQEGAWLAAAGERFALLADNGIGWAIADLALQQRRLPSVPLPGYFTQQQILHVIDDAGIDSLLTDNPRQARELLRGWRRCGVSRTDRTHDVQSSA